MKRMIQTIIEDKIPSLGYYVLASLLQKYSFNTIITTNFDNLIQDALIYSGHKRALVITHQDLAKFIKRDNTPLITKIHGDAHMHPFNNIDDTKKIPDDLKGAIQGLFTNSKIVFIGYNGGDNSILDLFKGCKGIDQIYWCSSKEPEKLKISEWLNEIKNKTYVNERDFDKIMNLIKLKFNFDKPDFMKIVEKLERSYTDALSDEIDDLNAIKEKEKTVSDYLLLADSYYMKNKFEDAIVIYKKLLSEKYETSDIHFRLAFSYSELHNYDKAMKHYKLLLEKYESNNNYVAISNLGYIYSKKGEYEVSIDYYKKSIELNDSYATPYLNLFELNILLDEDIDEVLEKNFLAKFHDIEEMMFKYNMIKIIKKIINQEEPNIVEWLNNYENTNYRWSFREFELISESQKDEKIKIKLNEAIKVFKSNTKEI